MYPSESIPNCDNIPGCPKWCKGNPIPSSKIIAKINYAACTNYITKEECEKHSANGLINEGCLWLNQKDPYFNSQCIRNENLPENPNLGTYCLGGTGCYWGCFGSGYRPTLVNTYVSITDQRIDEQGKKHIFDPVSERFISDIFNCCYPKNCMNYNYGYCSDFAEKYYSNHYENCNVCDS